MARLPSRVLAATGWAALGIAAAIGVGLAAVTFLATASFSRSFIAARVVKVLDDAIAGHVALKSVAVMQHGGVELEGLEISDPEGHLVLSVGRARVALDVTGLLRRAVGISLELDAPSVMLEEERGGGVSITRAFAPANPSPPKQTPVGEGGSGWTIFVSKVAIRGGDVWWVDAGHDTRLEASGLDLDARGLWGPRGARAELRLRGDLVAPVSTPISLELAGALDGTAVRLPVLRAQLGRTAIALAGEGDVARRAGRVVLLRVEIARDLARAVASGVPPGADLDAIGYAESDGTMLTAAVRAEPRGERADGRADAAIALRLADPVVALGFDVAVDRLDPSRLAAEAPPGEITLAARGAAAGRSFRDLRGRIEARIQASRLRNGEIRSAEIVARADRGTIDVSRAVVVAPGLSLDGAVRWREGGAVAGHVHADASDLAALARNVSGLLGTRPAAIAGRARIDATLGGTWDAPTASATVDAPLVRTGSIAISGARVEVEGAGPARALSARVEGRVAAVRSGGAEVAHSVSLRGSLAEGSGTLDAVAWLPGFEEPARIEARGQLSPTLDVLSLSSLALSYPGTRWVLAAPAEVSLAGPSVDRLELADGVQRVVLSGGLGPGGELDASASVTRLDLSRLPMRLLGAEGVLRGELGADARATGRIEQPLVSATFTLAGSAVRDLPGISAAGSAEWSGVARRATARVSVSRGQGTLDVAADVPVPLAGRPGERIRASVRAAGLPVGDLLVLSGITADAGGVVSVDAAVEGTVGAPTLRATAAVSDARWRDLDAIGLEVTVEDDGERVVATARIALRGAAVANANAEAPLDLSDLLARPAETLRAFRAAPLAGNAAVTGLDLAALSGRAGVPEGLAGRVDAAATVSGSLERPRAETTLDLSQGAWAGYSDVGAHAALSLGKDATSATGSVAVAGDEALRFDLALSAPPEKLATLAAIRAVPLRAEVVIPGVSLERTGPRDLPLAGTVSGKLTASGTPGAPEATLLVEGEGLAVEGRPLGKARLEASYARARAAAALLVEPPIGGTLRAKAALQADLGLGARRPPLGEAPAEISVVADAVDLSVAAALFPRRVRSAGGTLTADASARGPLARLSPLGTLRVRDGRVAVAEYGEFSGISLDATATEDAIEVAHLEVRRGKGKLSASAALRGLSSATARLELTASASTSGGGSQMQFKNVDIGDFNVTLFYDTYETGEDVRNKINSITSLVFPTVSQKETKQPPLCAFIWGGFVYKGKVSKVSQKFLMFLSTGIPVRAELELTFKTVLTKEEDQKNKGKEACRKLWMVKKGERLDIIADQALKDPKMWRKIAETNNIQDPLTYPSDNDVGKWNIIPD